MIVFEDITFKSTDPFVGLRQMRGETRETLEITIFNSDYKDISEHFVDGMAFTLVADNGEEFDKSEYSVAGDIIDKRDGTFVAYACRKTVLEILEETNALLLLELGGIR